MNTPDPRENDEARARAEARVLAVLLGEADPVEAAAVDELLRADAGLRAYRDALLETLPLLREAGRLTRATPDLRMDESRRAALLEQLRAPASRKGKGNVIPWTRWLRQNWPALAACGALLVGGATGIFGLDQRDGVAISSQDFAKENNVFVFATGSGGGTQGMPLREVTASLSFENAPVAEEKMVPLEVELPPAILTGTPMPMSHWAADGVPVRRSSALPSSPAPSSAPKSSSVPMAGNDSNISSGGRGGADGSRRGTIDMPRDGAVSRMARPEEKKPVAGENFEMANRENRASSIAGVGGVGAQPAGRLSMEAKNGAMLGHAMLDSVDDEEVFSREQPAKEIAAKDFKREKQTPAQPRTEIPTAENPFSTFSLNVSDASFQLARAALQRRQWPDAAALRTEEFVNALRYGDAPPRPHEAVSLTQEQAHDPFAHGRTLLRLSVQTASAGRNFRQPLNLTVLLDTSGSMERADRQEILREALASLAAQLRPDDTVSVLGFARTPRLLLSPTRGEAAAEKLRQLAGNIPPEGGTNLSAALVLAYAQNRQTRTAASLNRIVLLTDGAANLGDADPAQLAALVKSRSAEEATLDCFGVGFDDYNDAVLETLARESHGRYAYLNSAVQAREDFARQLAGALQVAAKNVKVQVEFNPGRVSAHHLFGYEKHQLRAEEFRDNTVRAAELGAAESGTALYRLALRPDGHGEIGTVRVRYQDPRSGEFRERSWVIPFEPAPPLFDQAAQGVRWAAVAAYFAEKLQGGPDGEMVEVEFLRDAARRLGAADIPPEENRNLLQMLEQACRLE